MIGVFMTAALALSQPATQAGGPGCELDGIPETDLLALRVAMVQQVTQGTPRPAAAAGTLDRVRAKGSECAGGSSAAGEQAAARFAANALGEKLLADGIDRNKIDGIIRDTDATVLDAFAAKRFDAPGVSDLGDRVTRAAGKKASETTRKLLGAYTFNAVLATRAAPVKPSGPVER